MDLRPREELSDILSSIPGVKKTYYSPPATIQMAPMNYPCIRYSLSGIPIRRADNIGYFGRKRYTLTLIDENPDSTIPNDILELPYCSFDRMYVSDGLNHFVFTLYF